jgi:tRNA modification GTPase
LRQTNDQIEAIGVDRAGKLIEAADVLVWLGDSDGALDHPRRLLVHSKADLPGRAIGPDGSVPVSSMTGAGIPMLLEEIGRLARSVLPSEDAIALNRRQAEHIAEAAAALDEAAASHDVVLIAESLRRARAAFDRVTGRAGVEDVLDTLFGRFCLGK